MRLFVPTLQLFDVTSSGRRLQAGDVLLVRHHGIVPALIRFFERLRKPRGVSRADWAWACQFNHACPAVDGNTVAQATGRGIVLSSVRDLDAEKIVVVRFFYGDVGPLAISRAIRFARESVGTGYGFLQIVADAFNALTGLELSFGWGDKMVCSTQSCRFMERCGLIPDRSPAAVTPAHLAWYVKRPFSEV